MIFKRDLAANGVTQLEAIFSSIISTFFPAPGCLPLSLRENRGHPAPTGRSYAGTGLCKPIFSSAQPRLPMERQLHRSLKDWSVKVPQGCWVSDVIWGTNCNS